MGKFLDPSVSERKKQIVDLVELSKSSFDSLYNLSYSKKAVDISLNTIEPMVEHLMVTTDLPSDKILDSLKLNKFSWINKFIIKKYIDVGVGTETSITNYIFRKVPLIVFSIIPVYAFLLYIFFFRKGPYFEHLIHSIHLHSFFFFFMGWNWIISLFDGELGNYSLIFALITAVIYTLKSFREVYQMKLFWCAVRLLIISILYVFLISIIFLFGIVASFALF